VPRNRGRRWLHRCLCLLIVALAVKNPDYKIPDADECEQSSQETPKPNLAPLAEHAVEDQIEPTRRRRESVPTDAPIIQSRNRPEKERANQLSPPPCLQDIPETIQARVSKSSRENQQHWDNGDDKYNNRYRNRRQIVHHGIYWTSPVKKPAKPVPIKSKRKGICCGAEKPAGKLVAEANST